MANVPQIFGMKKTMARMLSYQKTSIDNVRKGLGRVGLRIQRGSQKRCPVEFGNLKTSAFTMSKNFDPPRPSWKGEADSGDLNAAYSEATDYARQKIKKNDRGMISDPTVVVGHGANYALFVHENLQASHKVGEAKFLERSVQENQASVVGELKKSWSV